MEITVRVPPGPDRVAILGPGERNVKMLREALGVGVASRDGRLRITGERANVLTARRVIERLAGAVEEGSNLSRQQVLDVIAEEAGKAAGDEAGNAEGGAGSANSAGGGGVEFEPERWDGRLNVYAAGRPVRPRTVNQERYLDLIRDCDLVFGVGPAGTGKTYLAVAAAVHLLRTDRVKKLILARPAVEAGEKLGYLPGDVRAKVNPYLRPLLDALHDMMDFATLRRFMENDVVEVVPLAFMRGRTLNAAMVILDEAQNATKAQMKMFLTRLGHGSKMVVTGDLTQVDLPDPGESGLVDAVRRLGKADGVGVVGFEKGDVVRHPLVQRVIEAYGDEEPRRRGRKPDKPQGDVGGGTMVG